jgi:LptA/(LptD N-terminal domain) LPS transport protein
MRPLPVTRLLAVLAAGGLCVRAAQTQTAPPKAGELKSGGSKSAQGKPATRRTNSMTIGDVTLTYETSLDMDGAGNFTITGAGSTIETTDKQHDTQLLIVADHIKGTRRKGQETAQFDDNVHYTVRQKTKAGGRIIQGTADSALYTAGNKTLRLTRNVNATLTDPARFDAPATLRVGRLIVSESGDYQMTGDAGTNDLNFTPHYEPVKPDAGQAAPFRVGTAHIYGFSKGVMEVGQSARFDGPQVTAETANAQEKTQNTLKAPHVVAQLQENKQRMEAEGGVQFSSSRADIQNNIQVIAGTGDSAVFVDAIREKDKSTKKTKVITPAQLDVSGGINATLTNPVSLREPATLVADHLTAHLGDEPRYIVTGSPARTRFTLTPRLASRQEKVETAPAVSSNAGTPNNAAPNKEMPGNRPPDTAPLNEATVQNASPPANGGALAGANAGSKATPPATAAIDADDQDDLKNKPTDAGTSETSAPPFVIGDLAASAFQTATYVPDKSLVIEGPKVRFTSSDATTKNYAEMLTPRLEADFAMNSVKVAANKIRKVATLTEMRATNGVSYKFQKPLPSGGTEMLTGTGRTSAFTNGAKSQIVKVEGVSMVELTNPEISDKPTPYYGDGDTDKMSYDFLSRDFHLIVPKKGGKIVFYPHTDAENKPAADSKANKKKPTAKKSN